MLVQSACANYHHWRSYAFRISLPFLQVAWLFSVLLCGSIVRWRLLLLLVCSATLSLFYKHHLGKLLTIWCSHDILGFDFELYRTALFHWIAYASCVIFASLQIVWCKFIVLVPAFPYPRFDHSLHYLMLLRVASECFTMLRFVWTSRVAHDCHCLCECQRFVGLLGLLRSSLMLFDAS